MRKKKDMARLGHGAVMGLRAKRKKARHLVRMTRGVMGLEDNNVLYDPPLGWRYGFPKFYRPLRGESLEDTLRRDGYPQKELDRGGGKYVRFMGDKKAIAVVMAKLDGRIAKPRKKQ